MKAFKLRELIAKAGRSEKYNGFAVSELRTYLFDNAEAIAELIEAAEKVKHYECEDSWYSCPESENGCSDDRKVGCNCYAGELIKALDKIKE